MCDLPAATACHVDRTYHWRVCWVCSWVVCSRLDCQSVRLEHAQRHRVLCQSPPDDCRAAGVVPVQLTHRATSLCSLHVGLPKHIKFYRCIQIQLLQAKWKLAPFNLALLWDYPIHWTASVPPSPWPWSTNGILDCFRFVMLVGFLFSNFSLFFVSGLVHTLNIMI